MGLGGCNIPDDCDGNVELLLVELRLLFNDDKLTLLPVLAPLLLFCDESECPADARTFGAEVLSPKLGKGIAGFMKRSLRRPCKCVSCEKKKKKKEVNGIQEAN